MKRTIANSPFHPAWPEASWNISGLFAYDPMLDLFFRELDQHSSSLPIGSIHGAPSVKWNGGRYNISPKELDFTHIKDRIQELNERNIAVGLTFTNSLLKDDDFEDSAGNLLLELIDKGSSQNFVVINNSRLGEYIAAQYPRIRLSSSITKVAADRGHGKISYYHQLEQIFPIVVLHPDDNLNWKLVEELDKSQLEVCVNEQCIQECPVRRNHYQLSDRYIYSKNSTDLEAVERLEQKACICGTAILDKSQNPSLKRRTSLSKPEVKRHYDLGVRQFKIQSRRDPNFGSHNLLYDLCHYILEPDTFAELVFKKILRLTL